MTKNARARHAAPSKSARIARRAAVGVVGAPLAMLAVAGQAGAAEINVDGALNDDDAFGAVTVTDAPKGFDLASLPVDTGIADSVLGGGLPVNITDLTNLGLPATPDLGGADVQSFKGGGLPGVDALPALPGLPSVPGVDALALPSLPSLPGAGAVALPALPGADALGALPGPDLFSAIPAVGVVPSIPAELPEAPGLDVLDGVTDLVALPDLPVNVLDGVLGGGAAQESQAADDDDSEDAEEGDSDEDGDESEDADESEGSDDSGTGGSDRFSATDLVTGTLGGLF